jgi:enoyl-CoA hydratase
MTGSLSTERRGSVVILTIDRQSVRNAYDATTLLALTDALVGCASSGARAAVLTGAGEASFSAGMDLKALSTAPPGVIARAVAAFRGVMDDPDRIPVIAAVNGPATGGGFETVMRCDLAVAAEHATFRLPEVQRGIVPGGGATLLPARLPIGLAQELAILGEPISATRAYELGLVNRVVPANEVLDVAVAFGERIAQNGPRAVARTRALLWMTFNEGVAAAWAETGRSNEDPGLRSEMEEGIAAFMEKRSPSWSPR